VEEAESLYVAYGGVNWSYHCGNSICSHQPWAHKPVEDSSSKQKSRVTFQTQPQASAVFTKKACRRKLPSHRWHGPIALQYLGVHSGAQPLLSPPYPEPIMHFSLSASPLHAFICRPPCLKGVRVEGKCLNKETIQTHRNLLIRGPWRQFSPLWLNA
jgi:hypothetical protein